ncbi:MAG: DUF4923 family protein [Muribaculaceae bacterium]|nr:DUF4923 family protein [Muribaculaceae bacterium]
MKKIFIVIVTMAACLNACATAKPDIKDILGKLGGAGSETEQTDDNSSSSSSSSGILGAIGSFVNNTIANNNFTVDDLTGTWNYQSPAVSFQSDNALKKIGGAGAATALESKIEPYYTRLGFNKTTLTVDADHNFVLKMGVLTLKGTVEKDSDDMLVFSFSAFGKISLGKMKANATKAGSTLNLTFEATKMIEILSKVASVLNNSTLSTLTSLLESYDGVYIGFKLKKQ